MAWHVFLENLHYLKDRRRTFRNSLQTVRFANSYWSSKIAQVSQTHSTNIMTREIIAS